MTIRCAIYTRTILNRSELHSAQRQAATAFIAENEVHGWNCVGTYQDVGQSALHLDRPGLKQLRADVAAGQIDCVVVESLERLSRSISDLQQLAAEFRQHSVTVACVSAGSIVSRW